LCFVAEIGQLGQLTALLYKRVSRREGEQLYVLLMYMHEYMLERIEIFQEKRNECM
jgi:hypothetical protein